MSLESVDELLMLQEALDEPLRAMEGVTVQWSEATMIQVALKSFGALDPALWLRVGELVEHVASSLVPFKVELEAVSAHPSAGSARLIQARLGMGSELAQGLHKVIEEYLERIGIAKDPRPFWPGAVVGLVGSERGAVDLGEVLEGCAPGGGLGETFVRDLVLYRGQLKRGRPRWTVQRRFPLGKREG